MSSIILDVIYGAAYESADSLLAVHRVVGLHATGPGTPYDTSLVIALTSLDLTRPHDNFRPIESSEIEIF